jgi:hypothetical protein
MCLAGSVKRRKCARRARPPCRHLLQPCSHGWALGHGGGVSQSATHRDLRRQSSLCAEGARAAARFTWSCNGSTAIRPPWTLRWMDSKAPATGNYRCTPHCAHIPGCSPTGGRSPPIYATRRRSTDASSPLVPRHDRQAMTSSPRRLKSSTHSLRSRATCAGGPPKPAPVWGRQWQAVPHD